MKSKILGWTTALCLFVALAMPLGLAAQDDAAQAKKAAVPQSFRGLDGAQPLDLVLDPADNPSGTTLEGGIEGCSIVFSPECGGVFKHILPTSGSFTATGSMIYGRVQSAAALLSDGRVLVTGGDQIQYGAILNSAEVYDPTTGKFSLTAGLMEIPRFDHTATLLKTGKVLVTGGENIIGRGRSELFNPATGTFTPTGGMSTARLGHAAVLLRSGQVLTLGGAEGVGTLPLATAELYDPTTGTFSPTGSMEGPRFGPTATLLTDGKVLVTGGRDINYNALSTAELYDPTTGIFTPTGKMRAARYLHQAILLRTGKVLVAGGWNQTTVLASAELYHPSTGSFTPTPSMKAARAELGIALLSNGTVLVTGGEDVNQNSLATAEVYNPVTASFTQTGTMGKQRAFPTVVALRNKTVLVTGGRGVSGGWVVSWANSELYH
jgi:hypothetical protein